LLKFLKDHYFI